MPMCQLAALAFGLGIFIALLFRMFELCCSAWHGIRHIDLLIHWHIDSLTHYLWIDYQMK